MQHKSKFSRTGQVAVLIQRYIEVSYYFCFYFQFNDSNEEDRKELEGFALKMISRAKVQFVQTVLFRFERV